MPTKEKFDLTYKHHAEIRKAYNAGRKTITLFGKEYTIRLQVKNVSYVMGGETHKATEKWLIVKPADGRLIPTASIELVPGGNSRTH